MRIPACAAAGPLLSVFATIFDTDDGPGARPMSGGRAHLPACRGAVATGLRATLAVVHLVLTAFLGAGRADVGAQGAELGRELTAARHEARRQAADLGAVDVRRNAARHHLDIVFAKTGSGALVTGQRARIAGVYTFLEIFVGHHASLSV